MPIPTKEESNLRITAKELVLNAVQDWIISGVLKPGEKIIDSEIAKYFSVSRTPVREALQSLSEQGLVEVVPSCGTRVSEIDWNDIKKCYELIAELQIVAARMAYHSMGQKDFTMLRKINSDFEQAISAGTIKDQQHEDALFHGYLIDKADNGYLKQYIEHLMLRILRSENLYFGVNINRRASINQHRIIVDSLEAGDLAGMENAMRDNWIGAYNHVKASSQVSGHSSENK